MKIICTIYNILFKISTVIMAIVTIWIGYWAFFDHPEVNSLEINRIDNVADIHVGGKILVHNKGCVLISPEPNSGERIIRNAYVFVINDISVIGSGCYDRVRPYPVPPTAHLGPHTYQFCALFPINPIKTERRCNPVIHFNVLPEILTPKKGEKGDKGDKGAKGDQGEPGVDVK